MGGLGPNLAQIFPDIVLRGKVYPDAGFT